MDSYFRVAERAACPQQSRKSEYFIARERSRSSEFKPIALVSRFACPASLSGNPFSQNGTLPWPQRPQNFSNTAIIRAKTVLGVSLALWRALRYVAESWHCAVAGPHNLTPCRGASVGHSRGGTRFNVGVMTRFEVLPHPRPAVWRGLPNTFTRVVAEAEEFAATPRLHQHQHQPHQPTPTPTPAPTMMRAPTSSTSLTESSKRQVVCRTQQ